MKKIWTVLLAVEIFGCSPAEAENPSTTLREFYQAIASHDCQKAMALSEAYTLERCQKIDSLQFVIGEETDKAVLILLTGNTVKTR